MTARIYKVLFLLTASLAIIAVFGHSKTLAVDCSSNDLTTQQAIQCGTNDSAGVPGGGTPVKDLNTTIANLVNVISIVVGITAVIMIIVGGFRYITSGGKQESITSAKNTILYAIIGLVVVAVAQIIVRFVLNKATDTNSSSGSSSIGPVRPGP